MKTVVVSFGGVSPEHEVSVITGLQVLEHTDRKLFQVHALFVSDNGEYFLLSNAQSRSDFLNGRRSPVLFGVDEKGGFLQTKGIFAQKIYPDCAFFAFHGGKGESGPLQGLFDSLKIPFTSSSVAASSVSMNKALTKEVVSAYGIDVIPGVVVSSADVTAQTKIPLKLPVIVKPAHLGSSIGVAVAETNAALTKALLASAQVDSEIIVEQLMKDFTEYNCAVRKINGKLEASEVEKPLRKDEILSFADKYQRGGGKKSSGMASLSRELPAHITKELRKQIQETAMRVYGSIRAKGMIRCDFMVVKKKLYLIEVNPIPGSMAFYLWEASGISFTDQITDLINEAIRDYEMDSSKKLTYHTDIIEKFVNSTGQ